MTTDTESKALAPAPPADLLQQWTSTVRLEDGSTLTIRPLLPDDRDTHEDEDSNALLESCCRKIIR